VRVLRSLRDHRRVVPGAVVSALRECCRDVQGYMTTREPVMVEYERRAEAAKVDPLLAVLYFIEAAGDRRVECDVIAPSVLTDIRDRARKAIEQQTGAPFFNPLYR
jgi:hypothetical protein